mmetsp:Transcript_25302/g.39984  ORF Transcript_25302/g.39984 Transcript_25302/m.39984 type:complete len:318 (-) Transcript_25302:3-956(-)
MPLHWLDFICPIHNDHTLHNDDHHSHDNPFEQHHFHDSGVGHRPSSAAFLSTETHLIHGVGSTKLSMRQAAAFLEGPDIAQTHSSASSFLSVQQRLTEVVQATPPAALIPLHAISIMAAVPGHLAFELGEGFLFGFQKGFALAFVGKSLGAAGSFIAGRSALACGGLGDRLKSWMSEWPIANKVARGVERGGGASVLVIRLAPVPCVVKNYSVALLTEIPFAPYLLASLLGLLPTTAAHVYAGTLAPSAIALASGTAHLNRLQTVALASPVIAGCLLTAYAGYYLHQHVLKDEDGSKDEEVERVFQKSSIDKPCKLD